MSKQSVRCLFLCAGVLALCSAGTSAFAASIYVGNNSFESPTLAPAPTRSFLKAPGKIRSGDWVQSHTAAAGAVNNTNGAFGAQPSGVDGTNVGWLVNGQSIWQDLTDIFQVGQSYDADGRRCLARRHGRIADRYAPIEFVWRSGWTFPLCRRLR